MYRLIAFDMDGTMLDEKKQVPERNIRAIKAAAERGCVIVPATGRMVCGMPSVLRELPFIRYYIAMNGALVWDAAEEAVLYSGEMELETVLRLFEYLDPLPLSYDCYKDGQGYISQAEYDRLDEYFALIPQMTDYVRSIRRPVPDLKAALRQWGGRVQKIQLYFTPAELELRERLLESLPALFPELCFTSSLKNNIEVNSIRAGKGPGLRMLCEKLGIPIEETIAFGDGGNDCEMLRAAGLGVCMENGCEEARRAADLIAPSNDEAGLGQVIEALIESGRI